MFDTPIGRCAIVWRGSAVIGSALPEDTNDRMRASLQKRFPGATQQAPSPAASNAAEAVVRLLSGGAEDFSLIEIDLGALTPFEQAVLKATFTIPAGETRSYGEIAKAVGVPGASRAVGRALGSNPIPIIVPCHRVVAAEGRSGGFSAPGGASTKLKLLEIEGARRGSEPQLFERLPWQVKPA
jgi:methylated-DNA-[protein]-cysteine S-methyltransferase